MKTKPGLGKLIFLLIATAVLAGCGATQYKVKPELVESFQEPDVPDDKTGVYVIRGSNFAGSGRKVWVAVNDEVIASLPNASHVYVELDAGLNSLHFVQATAGFGYLPIDNKPGKVVYTQFGYATTGETIELEEDLGKSTVAQTRGVEPIEEVRPNSALDNLLINPGVLGYPIMTDSDAPVEADSEHAVVRFYRPDKLIANWAFDIWNESGYLGSTKGNTYFSVKLLAGQHRFISRSERYSLLDAELEAGKEYAVELSVGMGWNQAHIKLLPMDLSEKKAAQKVESWKRSLASKVLDDHVLQSKEIAPRIKSGFEYVSKETVTLKQDGAASRELPASFGI